MSTPTASIDPAATLARLRLVLQFHSLHAPAMPKPADHDGHPHSHVNATTIARPLSLLDVSTDATERTRPMSATTKPYCQFPLDTPSMLTVDDMIQLFPGTSRSTWHQLRHAGTGPAAVKLAGRLFYPRDVVEDWANARLSPAA